MNRRRFLVGSASASAARSAVLGRPRQAPRPTTSSPTRTSASSAEFLLEDFYAQALDAKSSLARSANVLRHGRSAAHQHAAGAQPTCSPGAGTRPRVAEDFEFVWPTRTLRERTDNRGDRRAVLRPLLGAYQTRHRVGLGADYRVLYASLAASVGQQLGALRAAAPSASSRFPSPSTSKPPALRSRPYLG